MAEESNRKGRDHPPLLNFNNGKFLARTIARGNMFIYSYGKGRERRWMAEEGEAAGK
jgi:hypothetical protein